MSTVRVLVAWSALARQAGKATHVTKPSVLTAVSTACVPLLETVNASTAGPAPIVEKVGIATGGDSIKIDIQQERQ